MKRTPVSFYGGKSKMLKNILPNIPSHKIYVEPYFGGGAVFFAKGTSFLEVINDIDHNVLNFYQIMKTNFNALLQEIELSLFDENAFRKASVIYKNSKGYSKVKRAYAFWYLVNFSFSNKIGGGIKFDNGTSGTHFGQTFNTKKQQFHLYCDRLENVQIQSREALEVLRSRNTPETFSFLDPPYPKTDQGHYKKYGFNIEKLVELLNFLENEYIGKFMLCNYWHPELESFLKRNPHWNIKYYDMRLSAAHVKAKRSRKKEIIITNYTTTPTLF